MTSTEDRYAKKDNQEKEENDLYGFEDKPVKKEPRTLESAPPLEKPLQIKLKENLVKEKRKTIQYEQEMICDIDSKNYVPANIDMLKNALAGQKALNMLYKPYTDDKAQVDLPQWIDILLEFYESDDMDRLENANPVANYIMHTGQFDGYLAHYGININDEGMRKQAQDIKDRFVKIHNWKTWSREEIYEGIKTEFDAESDNFRLMANRREYVDQKTGKLKTVELEHQWLKKNHLKILNKMDFICRNIPHFLAYSLNFKASKQGYRQKRNTDVSQDRKNRPL